MELNNAIAELAALQKGMFAYQYAEGVLYYDSVTVAPEGSTEGRGEALGYLSGKDYDLIANPQVGELLDFLESRQGELSELRIAQVKELRRSYDQISKIPKDEYTAYAQLTNESSAVWHRCKQENDFDSFAPYIDRIVETMVRFAGYYEPGKNAYDVWLDQHERGLTREKLEIFFPRLRQTIVPLVHRIIQSGRQIDDSFLMKHYPAEQQRKLTDYLLKVLSIDPKHCTVGETEHPFTIEFSKNDVRIATNFKLNNVSSGIYSAVHEGGHALYELHTGDDMLYTCLARGTTMGIHESQSRLFENMIGRSEPFINLIFPKLLELFPAQLAGVDAHRFWLAVNKAQPSLIRTEADELTYCLHIMVRYEIEKKLFDGAIKARDIPALWSALMKEYLGVDVPDDRNGALQDSHWSGGQFGYFPSYAIGSAYAAQFLNVMSRSVDIAGAILSGDLSPMVSWLTDKIYRYGSSKEPEELLISATGEPFNPDYYLDYLSRKFSYIYQLG